MSIKIKENVNLKEKYKNCYCNEKNIEENSVSIFINEQENFKKTNNYFVQKIKHLEDRLFLFSEKCEFKIKELNNIIDNLKKELENQGKELLEYKNNDILNNAHYDNLEEINSNLNRIIEEKDEQHVEIIFMNKKLEKELFSSKENLNEIINAFFEKGELSVMEILQKKYVIQEKK